MTISDILNNGKTARQNVEEAIARAEADDSNSILEIIRERALERADEIDKKIAEIVQRHPARQSQDPGLDSASKPQNDIAQDIEREIGRLAGVPFVAKDNFLTFGSKTTAAAKMLENFEAPLQATAIERLEAEGAICIGKANLDAFAHGGSTENSAFGVTKNAHDKTRVAGGSSGGSAVAVARGIVPFALGSDTGGSIRQPSSFNGVVGYKPTYGMISRYGVVAMASSTDVVGPIASSVEDIELLCDVMAGRDGRDGTVLPDYFSARHSELVSESSKTSIYFVRHGQTDWNKQGRAMGRTDQPLNDEGRKQAEQAREKLKGKKIDLILSSPLKRAKETAEIINKDFNVPIIFRDELVERNFGEREGKISTPEDYEDNWDYEKSLTDTGESVKEIFERVHSLIDEIKEKYAGKNILVASHGGVARAFRFYFEKMPEDGKLAKYTTPNSEIIEYSFENNCWILGQAQNDGQPKPLKIGLINEFMGEGVDESVKHAITQYVTKLTEAGHAVSNVDLPMVKYSLPIYYIVVPAEISSNLARYDGVRYGLRSDTAKTLAEVYGKSRDAGFVDENKRRIMIGSYVLSSGFFDAYYLQAQKARTLLINEFNKLFEEYDFLIGPVAPTPAFKIGENIDDPIKMYLSDIMTVPASLAGLPAISMPAGKDENGLPIGVQIIGPMRSDVKLLDFAKEIKQ
ncbi:hypothetical protein FACS189431_4820 [Alphaproteobacteria bacterium]|nr:hypothetical protein FACS189431_4820 [Alphaproteobacteria bacterium]